MKRIDTLLMLVFFLFSIVTNGQKKTSTPWQSLTTQRGDVFIGKVNLGIGDSVLFMMNDQWPLYFPKEEIASLKPYSLLPGKGYFILNTTYGEEYKGYFTAIHKVYYRFRTLGGKKLLFRPKEVENFQFVKADIMPGETYLDNYYKIRFPLRRKAEGRLLGYEDQTFLFEVNDEKPTEYDKSDIQRIELEDRNFNELSGHENMLIFSQTGFNYKRGQGEYENKWLYLQNQVSYGISDNFSFTGGFATILPYLQGKGSYEIGKLHFAGTLFLTYVPGEGPVMGSQAAISIGVPDYFINFSASRAGRMYTANDWIGFSSLSFGGSFRMGRKSKLTWEYNKVASGWFYNNHEQANVVSVLWNACSRRHRWSFGLTFFGTEVNECTEFPCSEAHVPLPLFGYAYLFGGR